VTVSLAELNALSAAAAEALFLECCGSTRWARTMTERRPYPSLNALLAISDEIWANTTAADWAEAFASHPRIGEQAAEGSNHARTWSAGEQNTAAQSGPAARAALAEANARYERRFGRIYLVCATGRTAAELLADLEARLSNDPERELAVAAEEQRKITRLRLEKLCHE
jgi:OHCU decarboxylase